MWIVMIKKTGSDFWRTTCGCDTEESAHKAGIATVEYYNDYPYLLDKSAGCADLSMFDGENWEYKVEHHKGEWISYKDLKSLEQGETNESHV